MLGHSSVLPSALNCELRKHDKVPAVEYSVKTRCRRQGAAEPRRDGHLAKDQMLLGTISIEPFECISGRRELSAG
jgi:hypothetical protein